MYIFAILLHKQLCVPLYMVNVQSTVNSRIKKLHFSFLTRELQWCRNWGGRTCDLRKVSGMNLKICKLRSFLNREFTVLGIYTFVYTPKIFYTYLRYRCFYLTGIRNQIVDKLRKMFEKDSKDLEDSSISRFLRLN